MTTRHSSSRFDEQPRRSGEPRDPRTLRDPRETREPRENRESRDNRDIISSREGREIISPRDGREPRDTISPREQREPREGRDVTSTRDPQDTRGTRESRPEPMVEPGMDSRLFQRGDPRADPQGWASRPDAMMESRDSPFDNPRDTRVTRDPRSQRDPRDAYDGDEMDMDPPGRLTSYFLQGNGISREVIQADICRYLGKDATCLASTKNVS